MSLETRKKAEAKIGRIRKETGLPLCRLLEAAGIPERTWGEWGERRGQETRHNSNIRRSYYLTPEEVAAVIAYCTDNPLKGYRMLCWEKVDKNIASVSPSSGYNGIKRHNPGKKWETAKHGFDQPRAVQEQWHIDFSKSLFNIFSVVAR